MYWKTYFISTTWTTIWGLLLSTVKPFLIWRQPHGELHYASTKYCTIPMGKSFHIRSSVHLLENLVKINKFINQLTIRKDNSVVRVAIAAQGKRRGEERRRLKKGLLEILHARRREKRRRHKSKKKSERTESKGRIFFSEPEKFLDELLEDFPTFLCLQSIRRVVITDVRKHLSFGHTKH